MGLPRYVGKRLLETIPALLLVSLLIFGLLHLAPGDPITTMIGPYATQELIDAIKAQYGLDKPLPIQYVLWVAKVLKGNLGKSIQTGEEVAQMLVDRLGVTVSLALLSTLLSVVIAVPAGILAAINKGRGLDTATIGLTSLFLSVPDFVGATLLLVVGGVILQILPMVGYVSILKSPIEFVRHMIMPTVSLGLIYVGLLSRMIRSSLLDVLATDYVRTARAKGLAQRVVIFKHALRNALIPSVTLVTMNFANMLGGSIIIEEIFALPGVGRLMLRGVAQRDFPIVQGATLFIGLAFFVSGLLSDVALAAIDPRIRYH